jgi:hypothetical protein
MHSWWTEGAGGTARRGEWAGFLLIGGIYLLLALAYGAATPDLEAPDAGAHFRYAAFLQDHPQLPTYDLPTSLVSHQLVQQPPLYYALVTGLSALLRPATDLQATVDYEQAVLTPYFEKGLGKRATVSPPGVDPAVVWPLRLARGVSLLGGLLLVGATWVLARTLLRPSRVLPLAVTAVVAFNPQFLFTSTAITNDVWAAALSTAAVAAGALAAVRQPRLWVWFGVGALCGLATLTKYSGVIALLPVALLAVLLRPSWNWRRAAANRQVGAILMRQGILVALGFGAVAGLLLAHNFRQIGELFPMQPIITLLPGLIRPEPLEAHELWERIAFLTRSYTGIFGYGIRAAAPFFEIVDAALWLAAGGAVLLLFKAVAWPARDGARDLARAWVIALVWLLALIGSLAVWIRIMVAGEQGRLLFPAAAAVGILLVLGWIGWLPHRARRWAGAIVAAGFLGLALWQLQTVQNTYAAPPAIAQPFTPQRGVSATFAPGMKLVGYDLPKGAATEWGRPLPLTLYFSAAAPVPADYTLFLHLVDADNGMLYQFDGIPYGGRHPPRQWEAGEVFADQYTITPILPVTGTVTGTANTPAGELAALSLGFYPVLLPTDRIAVSDAAGNPIGDRLQLAPIRILPPGSLAARQAEVGAAAAPLARWQNGIRLDAAEVTRDAEGHPQALSLRWRTDQLMPQDYTIFVQALDDRGNLVAQIDRQPLDGGAPTSTWLVDEPIQDQAAFPQSTAGWQQIIVGLYDGAGRRLPLASTDGAAPAQPAPDYYVLLQQPS